jgi:transcriptional regulator with XRE-family HTH domain
VELGRELKRRRNEQKLTQDQLAEKIFVSKKTISNWETGKTTPDIDSLIRLAKLFNFSLDQLLLEGSDIVENIKKQEELKATRKLFSVAWITNVLFFFIFATQKYFGELSSFALTCLSIAVLANFILLLYFSKRVTLLGGNKSPIQQVFVKNKWLLLPFAFLILIMAVMMFVR